MMRFVTLADLSDAELRAALTAATKYQRAPQLRPLAGKTVALLFMNPSLRTLASMQAGVAQLGGSSFVIQPGAGSWQLETRTGVVMDGPAAEHIREAIPVLTEYADALAVRCFASGTSLAEDLEDGLIRQMADLSPRPFISLESAAAHPCQALADWKTLDDLHVPANGGRFVLSWAWHPKPLPFAVPASTLRMAARRGMDVRVLHPPGFELPDTLMGEARAIAGQAGGSVVATTDREAALDGAHVVYAKSWASAEHYGDAAADATARAGLRDWCVRESWFAPANPDARFLHCLPVRRNVVVADEVLDGPRSAVVQQAGNRLHAQKGLLGLMLGGEEVS